MVPVPVRSERREPVDKIWRNKSRYCCSSCVSEDVAEEDEVEVVLFAVVDVEEVVVGGAGVVADAVEEVVGAVVSVEAEEVAGTVVCVEETAEFGVGV